MFWRKLRLILTLNRPHLFVRLLVMPIRRFGIQTDDGEVVLGGMVRVGTWDGIPLFFTTMDWVAGITRRGEFSAIVCGMDLLRFTLEERLAVLAHEEGHIVLGHHADPGKRILAHELAADAYAARKVGAACNRLALARLEGVIDTDAQREEVQARLKALETLEAA